MTVLRIIIPLLAFFTAACSAGDNSAKAPPRITMKTDLGVVVFELYPDKAPVTVANFLRYVDEGAYHGAAFYRATHPENDPMIEVIQGGLWEPRREGEQGYAFVAPFPEIPHETTQMSGLSHTDGMMSMARNEPGTASSEIFISIGDNTELDFGGARNPDGQGFAVFGRVVEGMDVIHAINAAPTSDGEGFEGQIIIEPIRILNLTRNNKAL